MEAAPEQVVLIVVVVVRSVVLLRVVAVVRVVLVRVVAVVWVVSSSSRSRRPSNSDHVYDKDLFLK